MFEKICKSCKFHCVRFDTFITNVSHIFPVYSNRKTIKDMKVISRVLKPINKHNPKAQSVCVPKEKVTFNQFQEHIRKELCQKTL